jgi:hypothetical protein
LTFAGDPDRLVQDGPEPFETVELQTATDYAGSASENSLWIVDALLSRFSRQETRLSSWALPMPSG